MAGAAARPRGRQPQHHGASRPGCAPPGCVTAKPSIEDVDYRTPRRLDKALFQQLATCRWIAEHRNLLVTGPCGVGKSWLSCALAQKACRDGYTVHYARVPRLFADLDLAHGDGRFARLFRTLVKVDLLILDDWGPDRLSASQRRDLMEIVEDRYGRGSTLITSQLPVDNLARGHRRADLRRRHPRSHRPQRLPARTRRAVDAQDQSRPRRSRRRRATPAATARSRYQAGQGSKEMSAQRQPPARPRGSTGTSRARRCVASWGHSASRAGPSC